MLIHNGTGTLQNGAITNGSFQNGALKTVFKTVKRYKTVPVLLNGTVTKRYMWQNATLSQNGTLQNLTL